MHRLKTTIQRRGLPILVAVLLLGLGAGAMAQVSVTQSGLTLTSVPTCGEQEYLVYSGGGISCATLTAAVTLPDCKSKGQFLTIVKKGDVNQFECADVQVCK